MLEDRVPKKMRFSERSGADGTEYPIWRGEGIVGVAVSKLEAESLCRNQQELRRLASDRCNDLRKHRIEVHKLEMDVELLVCMLDKITRVLRRGCKEKEMLSAKEEASAILRKFSATHAALMKGDSGFTIVEALAALLLCGLLVTFSAVLMSSSIRASRIKVAAQQLTMDLRLARLTAVSKRSNVDVIVSGSPVNQYQYVDLRGKLRSETMPPGVRITSSTTPIRFLPNGSVLGGATTVLEVAVTDSILETRTVTTSPLGVPRLSIDRHGL